MIYSTRANLVFFFKLPPNSTVGPGRLSGRKKKKDRVTFLACPNYDRTERLPLVVIRTAQKPRYFAGREVSGASCV